MKLGRLFKAAVGVVTFPVAITKDVFTIGGIMTGKSQSYSADKIDEIAEELDDFTEGAE